MATGSLTRQQGCSASNFLTHNKTVMDSQPYKLTNQFGFVLFPKMRSVLWCKVKDPSLRAMVRIQMGTHMWQVCVTQVQMMIN